MIYSMRINQQATSNIEIPAKIRQVIFTIKNHRAKNDIFLT